MRSRSCCTTRNSAARSPATSATFRRAWTRSGESFDGGTGTAGKLINDPAIFDAAQRLVVGVDQSAILRWLIKDRQKSGIRKEYREHLKRTPPPPDATPTPSASQ